jgi:hypothetical protein
VSVIGVWEVRENCTGNEESKPEEGCKRAE